MTGSEKNIALVCNPTIENDKALKAADAVVRILKGKDIKFSIFTQYWPASWEGFTDAWIFGGDGTLNIFINQNPNIKIPLSIFRCGSGNDFHWMLYGEDTLEQQVEKILLGKTRAVDAGVCNGQLFLNGVGIGFDGAIVKDLLGKKKLAGKASYMLSILKNLVAFREKKFQFEANGLSIEKECFVISVANGQRYGGGFLVAPKASLYDSLLDLNIVGRVAPLKRMRLLPLLEKGLHVDEPFVQYEQSAFVVITTPAEAPAHLDGEFVSATRFEIACLPQKFLFSV
ncbi:MAG TPA: YegS/Rv2252/BmrU family lipid kinase [Flavisolibacter sp.]|jgi:diacylglycerol kinase (ATP)